MAAFQGLGADNGALKQALSAIQMRDGEDGDDTGDLEGISTSKQVIRRVTYLRNIQKTYMGEMELYKEERIALEKKYEEKYQLLYKQRKDIIDGLVEPTLSAEEETEYVPKDAEDKPDEKGIDGFWMQCMGNLEDIGMMYTQEDIPLLESITDINCSYSEGYNQFVLTFTFKENDYIENNVVNMIYDLEPDLMSNNSTLEKITKEPLIWKDGKDLTVTIENKRVKGKSGKNKGKVKTITKQIPKESFFHFFNDPIDEDDADSEEEEEDTENMFKLTMEMDYDIADSLRNMIIPEAIFWFTGENAPDDDDDEDYASDDDDEEDDGDYEEEDSEEDEDPRVAAGTSGGGGGGLITTGSNPRRGKKKGKKAGAGADGEKQECKQS